MNIPSILQDTTIFLAAAVLSVPLSKKLQLGSVLGYLLAGIAIGPWALGLIHRPDDILHFSEFGVVMFLFIVGLELKPSSLWSMRRDIVGLGLNQVLLTTLLIGGITWLLTGEHLFSFIVGMSLSLSSTAMALQAIQERNLLSTPSGKKGFSVLLFQDLAVIPMLAIIPMLSVTPSLEDNTDASLWTKVLLPLFVITLIIAFGQRITHPIFRYIASSRSREIFTATSLLLVVGIAVLMNAIGMSMALGTFLAGVLLSESEYRHELEANIEPFKSLLLGLFFISVGMSLEPSPLFERPGTVIFLLLALVASKFLILFGIASITRMQKRQSMLLACLLSQASEFAFVLLGLAKGHSLISDEQADILNLCVTLSMLTTPILLLFFDRLSLKFTEKSQTPPPEKDTELEEGSVIVAGYGRFGQIVTRLLHSCHLSATVLDHDPTHIEMVKKFGSKVYYGDATRPEMLEQAGIENAHVFVCAIDDPVQCTQVVRHVKENFPKVRVLARCRNLSHFFDLSDAKADYISRETFSSALETGVEALRSLGFQNYHAHLAAKKFRKFDEDGNRDLYAALRESQQGEKDYFQLARASRAQLEIQLKQEQSVFLEKKGQEWE